MTPDFWHERWANNQIGFHQAKVNALLMRHVGSLTLEKANSVFVPLCGKTLDIGWLMATGYRVVGAELSELAIQELFDDLRLTPEIEVMGSLKRYSSVGIVVFVGDFFDVTPEALGPVEAVYDRAALVAMPAEMRHQYSRHLTHVTGGVQQLLMTFEYDQAEMNGPPFSISAADVERHYDARLERVLLDTRDVAGGLKGRCPATESCWHLRPRA